MANILQKQMPGGVPTKTGSGKYGTFLSRACHFIKNETLTLVFFY